MAARGTSVLVVDDEKGIRLVCRVNLEVDGFRVFEAGTIDEAREVLASEDVRVALIDVHLGSADGLELVRELRRREPRRAIALLTGSVELSVEESAGADAILGKPFTIDELLDVVHRLAAAVDSQP
ncbi:MAG: response regulator [Gaiellaceae bacterium]